MAARSTLLSTAPTNLAAHQAHGAGRIARHLFLWPPLDHQNIGIHEAGRRAESMPATNGAKINDDIIILGLKDAKQRFAASEASISVAFGKALYEPPAKTPDCSRDQSRSHLPDGAAPAMTSRNPTLASGASVRESVGMANVTVHENYTCPALRDESRHRRSDGGFTFAGEDDVRPTILAPP